MNWLVRFPEIEILVKIEIAVRIGVISDTHGLFEKPIPSIFAGVDAIIHAGDIGKLEVIERLEAILKIFVRTS